MQKDNLNNDGMGQETNGNQALRRYLWRATYHDGLVVQEQTPDHPDGPRFEDLQKDRLERFALVDAATGDEVAALDCTRGVFWVHGHVFTPAWRGRALAGRRGVSYADVDQGKEGHVDWTAGAGSSGLVVDAHRIGYKADLPEARVVADLRLDVRTGRMSLWGWVSFPSDGLGFERVEFLLDGVPLEPGLTSLSSRRDGARGPGVVG